MAYDEMELDTIGDKKTALFLIMSDTDSTFNFVIAILQSQLTNLLCDKADDVYGGRRRCLDWRRSCPTALRPVQLTDSEIHRRAAPPDRGRRGKGGAAF